MNRITRNNDFIEYFLNGGRDQKKCNNLYIEDNKLFNYNTILLEEVENEIYFNTTKYSKSTSRIQTYIRQELYYMDRYIHNIHLIKDVERNTQSLSDLI